MTQNNLASKAVFTCIVITFYCASHVVGTYDSFSLEDIDQSKEKEREINIFELIDVIQRLDKMEENGLDSENEDNEASPLYRYSKRDKSMLSDSHLTTPGNSRHFFDSRAFHKRNNGFRYLLDAAHSLSRATSVDPRRNDRFHAWGG